MTLIEAQNRSDAGDILAHLEGCDGGFSPPLSSRLNLADYARKLAQNADRFEYWQGDVLAGLVAVYCNAPDRKTAFVSNVSVLPACRGKGLAEKLMQTACAHVSALGFGRLALEVDQMAEPAIALYRKLGFHMTTQAGPVIKMERPRPTAGRAEAPSCD